METANGCGPFDRNYWQTDMKVDSLLMLERDLLAVAALAVFTARLGFAMPVGVAATVRLAQRKVLFTRHAATP
jgi:hypothetical protein